MRRRRFLAAVGGVAFAGPIAAVAQQSAGIPRVGLLMGADPSDEAATIPWETFTIEGLRAIESAASTDEQTT